MCVCVVRPQKGLASNFCLLFSSSRCLVPRPLDPSAGLSMLAFCRNVNTLHILFSPDTRLMSSARRLSHASMDRMGVCNRVGSERRRDGGGSWTWHILTAAQTNCGDRKCAQIQVTTKSNDGAVDGPAREQDRQTERGRGLEGVVTRVTRITFLVSELIDSYANAS